jgi:nicotinate-nucleotide adenylyltransferase
VDGELGRALEGRWADNEQALFASPAGRILRLHHPLREESASAVRAQIAAGGPWRAAAAGRGRLCGRTRPVPLPTP